VGAAPPPRTGTFFPKETDRYELFYPDSLTTSDGALFPLMNAAKFKQESRDFDTEGNLLFMIDFGDEQTSADDIHYSMHYIKESGTHITRADTVQADGVVSGQILRKRTATYDSGKGTIATLTNVVTGGFDPATGTPRNQAPATSTFVHDGFGNLQKATDPNSYTLQYTYDTTAQTYATRVDDISFGYFSTAGYDLRFGLPTSNTDVNGQVQSIQYDQFGRTFRVYGPDDTPGSGEPTIEVTYNLAAFPISASVKHKDVQHAGDPIQTVTFADGLHRVIQTKTDIDQDVNGDGSVVRTGMTVSGQVTFDNRGRLSAQGQPVFDAGPAGTFVVSPMLNPTTYAYDALGRRTNVTVPDRTSLGIQTNTLYDIVSPIGLDHLVDGGTWLLTEVRDPNANFANQNVGRHLSYADSRGNQIAVRTFNQVGTSTTLTPLTTRYTYDPIDQLATVTDAKNKVTSAAYDTMGQLIVLNSPDAGQTLYRYDLAGNLGAKQTPVLRGQGTNVFTRYLYDFDRLRKIDFPTSTNVTYAYGGVNEGGDTNGNRAGRIKQVTSDGATEVRSYDRMGNVNQTLTTLPNMATPATPATVTFTMKYTYDWLGRMQTMTFPNWMNSNFTFVAGEGEKVSYVYDHGGSLDRITGHQQTTNPQQPSNPMDFVYLNHIGYDQFQQRNVLVSGNGIANQYAYDPLTRRLATVTASARGPQEQQQNRPPTSFHKLQYTYDRVGNVLHMKNNVSVQPWKNAPVFMGPLDVTYGYDNQYQLTSTSGKYRGNVAYGYQYSDTYRYDETGNITRKAQSQDRLVWDNQTVNTNDADPVSTQLAGSRFDRNLAPVTYTLDYQYTGPRPHATNAITETQPGQAAATRTYSYDTNGNNTGNTFRNVTRTQVWDEESRLKQVTIGGGSVATFRYDDGGERTKKHTSAGDSWYVNQYFVLQPGNRPTKHIFAGETRIASKTDPISMQTPVVTYYHPDHLGTTSYVSSATQDLIQHERYFAFGELWRPNGEQEEVLSTTDRRDWLFTSKEWDVDTSLYYFGARYFDPHADVWQSTDPMLAGYMRGAPNGGVFGPGHLGLYTYALNNPIALRDPNGLAEMGGIDAVTIREDQRRQRALAAASADAEKESRIWQTDRDFSRRLHSADPGPGPLGIPRLAPPIPELVANRETPLDSELAPLLVAGGVAGGIAKGAMALAATEETELVHMTTAEFGQEILAEGTLRGPIYAGPASNASARGLALSLRTGLSSTSTTAIRIPNAALGAFSRPVTLGPFSAWQRFTGAQFSAAGNLNLATGEFIRTGINWTQMAIYGLDTVFTGTAVGAVWYGASQ
jgi:RHS repeat-associated protein